MNRDGSSPTVVTGSLDRDAALPQWNAESDGLFFHYDDEGDTKVAFVPLDGEVEVEAQGWAAPPSAVPMGEVPFRWQATDRSRDQVLAGLERMVR